MDDTLKEVFEQHYPALVYFAQKMVKSKEDAEDITDEVFIKLWQKEPDFSQ